MNYKKFRIMVVVAAIIIAALIQCGHKPVLPAGTATNKEFKPIVNHSEIVDTI